MTKFSHYNNQPRTITQTTNILTGLEIGTTKVCAVIGRVTQEGKLKVLGESYTKLNHPLVHRMWYIDNSLVEAILKTISDAGKKAGIEVKNVQVGMTSPEIKSFHIKTSWTRDHPLEKIDETELKELINDAYETPVLPEEQVIKVIPQTYKLDNGKDLQNPQGKKGKRLTADRHVIVGPRSLVKTIMMSVQEAGLKTENLFVESIASAAACLTKADKKTGAACVDIGGETTDITIFQQGIFWDTAVIPMGGDIITEDIKEACDIREEEAENIKVDHGTAIPKEVQEDQTVFIPNALKPRKAISVRHIAQVIESRITEIIEHVEYEIKESGLRNQLKGGIAVTGGGAQLKLLPELMTDRTGTATTKYSPPPLIESRSQNKVDDPLFSTAVGLVLKGVQYSGNWETQ